WLACNGLKFDKCLTLGRQNFYTNARELHMLLHVFGIEPARIDQFPNPLPAYAEPFFQLLGATCVESMDASSFEGATYVHDLNQPIPAELAGRYDLVYDGGTLEHTFNFAQSLRNAMDLVKPGGSLILFSPCNNMAGHGFYSI